MDSEWIDDSGGIRRDGLSSNSGVSRPLELFHLHPCVLIIEIIFHVLQTVTFYTCSCFCYNHILFEVPAFSHDQENKSFLDSILLISNISKVTYKAAVTSIEGAHDASLEYGEPVEEGGRDEVLHHDDQHL